MYGFPKRLVGGGNCVRACNPGKCDPTQQRLLTGQALKTVVKSLGRTCNGDPTNSVSKSAPYISKGRVMLSTVFVFVYVCLFCVCVFFRQRFPSNEKHDTLRGLMFNLMETKSFSQSIRQQQVPSISSSSCSGFTMQRQCCLGESEDLLLHQEEDFHHQFHHQRIHHIHNCLAEHQHYLHWR